MQWSGWRWIRFIILAFVVVWLGQKFLLENGDVTFPGLDRLAHLNKLTHLEKSKESNSDNFILDQKLELGGVAQPIVAANPVAQPTQSFTSTIEPIPTVEPTSHPAPVVAETTQVTYVKEDPVNFPYISNTDVIVALNEYRAAHKIHQLVEQQNLCQYAEKRVKDLIDYGGLDHHEGFKEDFSGDEIPQALQSYPGTTIGENLAYQHCINMQTEESFIATSATALIEWCFDSSTAGHREAQLNPKFNNVCVRHKNGLFVVMFGD